MEEMLLPPVDERNGRCAWYKLPVKAIVLVTTGATLFAILLGILHTTQNELSEVHSMIDEQQVMLQDIRSLVNVTQSSSTDINSLLEQFDAFYKAAKLICMLNPEYKQYCSLL